jgi:sec-independent protein translocase protein TatA
MVGDILQPTHLLLILVVALLVLGPKRLPEVGRSLGRGIRDFRTALSFDEHETPDAYVTQASVDAAVADPLPPSAPPEDVATPAPVAAPAQAATAVASPVTSPVTNSAPATAVHPTEPLGPAG